MLDEQLSEVMREIAKELDSLCMELQQVYPEYTKSLLKPEDIEGKTSEEIDELIMNTPILASTRPYLLETSSWTRGKIVFRKSLETPDHITRHLEERFKSLFK